MARHLLLVEDDHASRAAVESALAATGYHITSVDSQAAARAIVDRERFDGLILDVVLPDGDGVSLLHHIRATQPTLAVIVVSGFQEQARETVHDGAQAFLLKPFDMGRLKDHV